MTTMKDDIRKEVRCWVVKNHWWIELDDKLTLDDITDFAMDKTLAAAIKVVEGTLTVDNFWRSSITAVRFKNVVLAKLKEVGK